MAILFFASKCVDGNGDIVHAGKVADYVDNLLRSKRFNQAIIIVVKTENEKEVVHRFLNNPRVQVKLLSEIQSNAPKINYCVEVSYGASFWRDALGKTVKNENIPCLSLPEYGWEGDFDLPKHFKLVTSGFSTGNGQTGVIPSQALLDSTAEEADPQEEIRRSFEKLDLKLGKYLSPDSGSYQIYRNSHDFSYQYSHDEMTPMSRPRSNIYLGDLSPGFMC